MTGFFATVIGEIASADLMPASGHQDHTLSPSALAPFVKSAAASTASRSNVRDDRETPLSVWDGTKSLYSCFYRAVKKNF